MGATKKTRREEMNNSKQFLYSILCFSLTLTLLVTAFPLGTFGSQSQVLADDTPQKTATGFFFIDYGPSFP